MRNKRRNSRGQRSLWLALAVIVCGLGVGIAAFMAAPWRVHKIGSQVAAVVAPILAPAPPLAPTALFEGTQNVAVLMYHDITDHPQVYFDISIRDFRKQLKQLEAAGAHFIPLADLYDHLATGKELPEKAVVLTFDDGYLGQYENAYPILKERHYPATFFVHTGVVGVKTSREHLSWDQLQALDKEGLVDIQCHTVTHPDDLRKCSDSQLEKELNDSKKTLEAKLNKKIRFLAYPVGNADARVARVAREAGYEMAMTMGPGWAHSPADSFFVPRFIPTRMNEICSRLKEGDLEVPFQPRLIDLEPSEIESGEEEDGIVKMKWIRGGHLCGVRLDNRRDVPSIVRATYAAAGLNGTFFSDARVNSQGAGIVGPIMTRLGPGFAPGLPGDRERIAGRPLVIISPTKMAFLPFDPHLALDAEGVKRLLPDATDCFLTGAWLVHDGEAVTHDQLESFHLENVFDYRPRAVLGVDGDGRPFLGAASTGNQSDRLARTLEGIGLKECVLLDSGFSTSLVLGQDVLVSGIRRKDMPARPVPHALLLYKVNSETGKEVLTPDTSSPGAGNLPVATSLEQLQAQFNGVPEVEEAEAAPARHSKGRSRGKRHRHHR